MAHHIALIRHGAYHQRANVPSALQPFPLTKGGKTQARACGAEIAKILRETGLELDPVLYSSCQLRAWQTAKIAREVLSETGCKITKITQKPALSERALGSAANLSVAEIEAVLTEDPRFETPPAGWKSDSDYCLPLQGAESLMQAGARVAEQLRGIAETGRDGWLTLVFGHGASFRHAAHHLGLLAREEIARLSMYHARPLRLCYTDDGKWTRSGGAWKQRRRDETAMD
ncbi:histidine phosphatase family protein [Tropicimonas sp. TH_r6]|uniref:histidine phosphatase family protein n=1 Tax=Tropicimonas sp. TH_r6 TaxID=3082085 RepID=UPI0029555EB3|nr:histidine phosphatase family protein [Tropicimonas sp. TH_r6]MDV7145319.1 histidine phosphatase family protein [Tropicimonas sp. TH_r6]